jgi:hypothetical protein
MTHHKTATVEGLSCSIEELATPLSEAGVAGRLLSLSQQFRSLIPALADKFHVISADYPGFGTNTFTGGSHVADILPCCRY